MGNEQMPDDSLKRLAMRCDVSRVHRWHDHRGCSLFGRVTAVPSDYANDGSTNSFGELNGADQVRADIFFQIAATYGKNQQAILGVQATAFEPLGKNRCPAFVIGSCGQFGNVVRGRVRLETTDFAEIIHGMTRVARAAANPKDEQPPAALPHACQFIGGLFNGVNVQLRDNLLDFIKELFGKAHGDFDCSSDSSSAKPAGEPIS